MLSLNRLALVVVSLVAAGACGFPADANRDGDMANGVGFQFPTSLTDETVGTHTVSVALSRPADDVVTVDVEVVESGTATPGEDFSLATGQISFPVGADRADIDITVIDDGNDTEGDQTIDLRLVNASNADIFRDDHTVTISDTPLPRFTWQEPASSAGEGAGAQTFQITFTRTLPVETQIAVATSGTAGVDDYTAPPTTLVIASGVDTFDVEVPIDDENIDEEDEIAALTLSAITGAILDPESNGVHSHTIVDNDDPPIAAFQVVTDTQGESAGTKQVVVTITPESGKTVMIGFNDNTGTTGGGASDGDYDINTTGPLVFTPGETQKTIAVLPLTDTLYEDNEVVALSLTVDTATATLSGTNGSTVLAIDDDDNPPGIGFMAATSNATEGNTQNVTVALTAVSGKPVSFSFTNTTGSASSPADYSFSSAEVTIPAGMATYTLPVTIADDNIAEGNENFTVGLTGITDATLGGNTTHVVTIQANDACQVRWDPTEEDGDSPEGDGSGSNDYPYEIQLTNPSATNVTVVVTRTGDASDVDAATIPALDAAPPDNDTTLTFTPGNTSQTVTVRVFRDDNGGGDGGEDIILTLSGPNGCTLGTPAVRNHHIGDDD
jgi:hypothetical protein